MHAITDGRDTSPRSASEYIKQLEDRLKEIKYGSLNTIVGRYYAMDRDKRWERVQVAVEALVSGKGEKADEAVKAIEERYSKDETDECADGSGFAELAGSSSRSSSAATSQDCRTATRSSRSTTARTECGRSPASWASTKTRSRTSRSRTSS